ncbi:MAG: GNAT family N-acetyltransferase [Planctomycetaceae bacterium]|nr:MAG: GNAT family N-acetyltransferase [Planctomycetaceae bacterium]
MKTVILKDVSVLAPLAQAWLMEVNNPFGIDIDVRTHLMDLQSLMDGNFSDVFGLQTTSGQIVGYMGIVRFENPIGKGYIGNEHYWYVHPDHRGSGSVLLIKAAMQWAKEMSCTHFMANASKLASELHDKVCKLYEKMRMQHFETSYMIEVT